LTQEAETDMLPGTCAFGQEQPFGSAGVWHKIDPDR
jgi:hypothetical protein